jgi:hypothetical protein
MLVEFIQFIFMQVEMTLLFIYYSSLLFHISLHQFDVIIYFANILILQN